MINDIVAQTVSINEILEHKELFNQNVLMFIKEYSKNDYSILKEHLDPKIVYFLELFRIQTFERFAFLLSSKEIYDTELQKKLWTLLKPFIT